MKLLDPWTPLVAEESGESVSIGVYGRRYTASTRSFLSSLTSQGKELLAAPARFVLREDGEDYTVDAGYLPLLMEGANEAEADVVTAVQSEQFILNIAMHAEFDGCLSFHLTVVPRGRTVAQLFGFEAVKPYTYRLDRLWLEIPLVREAAEFFQFYPQLPGQHVLSSGGELLESMALPHREQVFLTGNRVGLLTFLESEEGFSPLGRQNAIEILREEERVTLRIRFVDEEPEPWRTSCGNRGDLDPIIFRFGLMATPVKPMPERLFEERAVHIDCYKKIPEDYEDFLGSPFGDTDEVTYDRLVRLGVNTLYIHEKWNDLQNSPRLTARTARRLRTIIDECHRRGIKVIPYFGYEMSSLAPYYAEMRDATWRYSADSCRGSWYRQPPQRDTRVCRASAWSDFFVEGIDRLMTEYGFDGVYLDGTAYLPPCKNPAHGCGFTDSQGVRHATYPVMGTRATMRRLCEVVCEKHGGIINCHAGSAFNMPALSFATSLWDGEVFQTSFLHGRIHTLPDTYFRALYTGRNIGVPIFMLTYLNPPVWEFRMALSTALPFGILPKVNDAGEPLEEISAIWRVYDRFGVEEAEWLPYYGDEHPATVDDERVKLSAYRKDGRLLLILASTARENDITCTLKTPCRHLTDALTGAVISKDGTAEVRLEGFDFKLIEATP